MKNHLHKQINSENGRLILRKLIRSIGTRQFTKIFSLLALFLLFSIKPVFLKPVSAQTETTTEFIFQRSWGGGADQIRYPRAIAIGPDNRIFTINNGRMTVIDQETRTHSVWLDQFLPGALGAYVPMDITFDLEGNILLPIGDGIHKLSQSGTLLESWGEFGTNPGQFKSPKSTAVDEEGKIYVSDQGNQRIQVLSAEGEFLEIIDLGDIIPYSIALGNHNDLFIGDLSNRCIQKFDINGNHLLAFGEGITSDPYAIAVDDQDQVFVVSQYHSTIEVFSSDGAYLRTIGDRSNPGDQPGEFQWPEGLALDTQGNLYVSDTRNNRIQKLTNAGEFVTSWGGIMSNPGEFNGPSDVLITAEQHLLVVDTVNHRIQRFTEDGTFIASWGSEGYAQDQFKHPRAAVIDDIGNIYVADHDNCRIQVFNKNGEFIDSWSGGHDFLFHPSGMTINKLNNHLYISDTANHRIKVLDLDGNEQFTWGSFGQGNGEFIAPGGITSDLDGNIYVADSHRIQKFDRDGNFILTWGERGPALGNFDYPADLYIDAQNWIYVADSYNHRIQIFDLEGNFIASWGSYGRKPGQFDRPTSIFINGIGDVFVTEAGNNRIQVFNPEKPDPDPFSGSINNGLFEGGLNKWTCGGDLPVEVKTIDDHSNHALLLGMPVSQVEQETAQAWAYQSFYVNPEMDKPTLTFNYNIFTNDIMHYSDFFVAIQDGVGLNHLETVLRAGYPGSVAPAAGTDLGWRSVRFDLSAYKGQHIRLVFSNRNLWPISWGIWTYVDDVRVVEAADLPPADIIFLPMVTN
ncbi:MAG: SMP-30/gluconolactonase/LRE family protein [Anaerolineaceae bacterium]|nr:SMP-30/gluconolactonase/LRE family protein [Anaerolineaceae bacterium]